MQEKVSKWAQPAIWVVALIVASGAWLQTWRLIDTDFSRTAVEAESTLANLTLVGQERAERTLHSADQATRLVRALYLKDAKQFELRKLKESGALDSDTPFEISF